VLPRCFIGLDVKEGTGNERARRNYSRLVDNNSIPRMHLGNDVEAIKWSGDGDLLKTPGRKLDLSSTALEVNV